ncbi:MAG: domain S-box protein [Clostridia bacterium]|nr:domain S-box protein [Clostridia bacterium]
MLTGTILYITYSSVSIIVLMTMAFLFWKRRSAVGASSMMLIMILAVEWSMCTLLSSVCSYFEVKIFWDKLSYLGVVYIPVVWLIFSLQYTRKENDLKKGHIYLLLIIPCITLFMVFTNDYHHLFASQTRIELLKGSNLQLVVIDYASWFWIHASYSLSMIIVGMVILLYTLVRLSKIYTKQAIIMILAVLIPFSDQILFLLQLRPIKNLDTTTFSFTFTGVLFFIGMFRYRILDLIPVARTAVIETMEDLVVVLDNQKRIIDINTSAQDMLKMEYHQIIGQTIESVAEKIAFSKEINEIYRNGKIVLNIEGKKRYYDMKRSPLFNKKNYRIGEFIVLRDITSLEETMKELEWAKFTAEESNKAKSKFLAAMSHEIRTPINGIIGMAELLENASLTPEEKENLRILQYSADSLLDIINDILDFSKIEAGKMELQNTRINIRQLVSDIVKTFAYTEKKEYIELNYDINDNVPEVITGDLVRLRQILINLLSNAFKFTEKGKINIHIDAAEKEVNKVKLLLSISDTGIGIAENKLESLFQSFHQLDNSTKRKYGGTGLGLSIVKSLIELMGGTISVKSKEGIGSRFSFEITFETLDEVKIKEDLDLRDCLKKDMMLRVLVVEDSKVNQLLIKKMLTKKNWIVETAENGREALEKIEQDRYDLILMDIQMPIMDGYEAAKSIREKEMNSNIHTPIIALTANATEEDKRKSIEAGMDGYLTKPIKSENLYLNILKYVNISL